MSVKVVYACKKDKASVDKKLQRDLPSLREVYDFNVFRLLRVVKHTIAFQQALIVPIKPRYQVQLSPKHFDKKTQKIVIRATFLKRKKQKKKQPGRFAAYASVQIRLQNRGKVVFLGPSYKYGRVLLILTAQQR